MKIVECHSEGLEIFKLLSGDSGHQLFRADILLACLDHDRRAMRIGGAHVGALVAAKLLKSRPDIRLQIFHEVAHVNRAICVGECAGDEDFASHAVSVGVAIKAAVEGGDYGMNHIAARRGFLTLLRYPVVGLSRLEGAPMGH